jgi:hypothetical protein
VRAQVFGATLVAAAAVTAAHSPVLAQARAAGSLIQVMRGSVFRDANLIFDVQQVDPGAPPKPHNTGPGVTTSSNFSNIYTGWQVVENAAVMLDEGVDMMLKPRLCANGIPVPVGEPQYRKTAEGLRTVAHDILTAARARDRDRVIELAEPLADACAACHQVYRDLEGPKGFGDTSIRCKVPAAVRKTARGGNGDENPAP